MKMAMTRILEAWEFGDPAEVAERRELKALAAEARAARRRPLELIHNRRRIRALVARALKARAA